MCLTWTKMKGYLTEPLIGMRTIYMENNIMMCMNGHEKYLN